MHVKYKLNKKIIFVRKKLKVFLNNTFNE